MSANEVVSLLGEPKKIERVAGSKKEQWTKARTAR